MPPIIWHETVIAGVIQAAERQRGPEFASFRRVVVDNIENDFDPGGMEPAHRDAHFIARAV